RPRRLLLLLRAGTAPVIDSHIERSRVRVPPGALVAPVAQLVEHFRAVQPRPQQSLHQSPPAAGRLRMVLGRAPGPTPGGRRVRVRPEPRLRSSIHSVLDSTTAASRFNTTTRRDAVSYLLQYLRRSDSLAPHTPVPRVDEYLRLNRPGLYGDAY